MVLFKQQLRGDRGNLIGWAVGLAALTWFMVMMYDSLAASGTLHDLMEALQAMPAAMQAWLAGGMPIVTFSGFVAGTLYGGMLPVMLAIYVGLYIPGIVTRDVDQHNMEFLLSLPVRRVSVIVTRWLAFIAGLAGLLFIQWLTMVAVSGGRGDALRYLIADLNLFLLFATVGGLLMFVTVFIDDQSRGLGVSMALALGLYFVYLLTEQATGILRTLRKALPFAHFISGDIISFGKVPWGDGIGLAVAALVLLLLTIVAFDRKQIAA